MSRKTCNVEAMRNEVNTMLADSTCSPEQRMGMCQVLETMLHATGNYNGFTYLSKPEVPSYQLPGINEADINLPSDELYRVRFTSTDDTRRKYF